jgi:hypothetical protein
MATVSDNVRVGVTGAIYIAPSGTTLPTDATSALDAAFEELGFMDESGVVETQGESITNIKAWQNSAVVRKILTEHDLTYAFTALETNPVVLDAYYGNYTDGPDGVVEIRGEVAPNVCWVIDVIDGDEETRIVVPDGQITQRGAVTYGATDAVKYPMTLTAFPDASSVKAYIYYNTVGAS